MKEMSAIALPNKLYFSAFRLSFIIYSTWCSFCKEKNNKKKTIPGHGIIKMDTFLLFAILMKSKFKSSIAKSNNKQKLS